jgi:hypothetical protein
LEYLTRYHDTKGGMELAETIAWDVLIGTTVLSEAWS